MENKYFSVGERVGLVSKNYPELEGEYSISEYGGYRLVRNRITDVCSHQHLYTLKDCPAPNDETPKWWAQPALRKIHNSGGTSFEYMMNKLSAQEKAMSIIKNTIGEVK